MSIVTTTPGLYPLPDWGKDALSGLKGHQKGDLIGGDEDEEITAVYDEIREELIADQREAGLDLVVEGQARWDDMLAHPLAVHENVETRGIVRYYDNNNFYRDPVVTGELTESGDVARELRSASELTDSLQAVLPGPYSLADLATDEHYGEGEFLDAIADFLAGELAAFPSHETLFLLEPSLVENPPEDGEDERASEAIDRVAAATDADVIVHTYWGALEEKVHAHLLDADIDAVGYDFVSDVDDNLYNIQEYGTKDSIALGLLDGQNTLVESPETIAERIDWIGERLPAEEFETTYVTTNTELFYLPENKYKEKLAALGEVAAREEVTA
ncbi:5-methyltetrahydropteroyltriglutamate--homocysteine methyltransferase [Halalkalicoccus sp. NIPERK01]|uniref:5-methyltetrahydropteroyltriglutamate-- homocysteine methyltransferase n=1 Tax=Halalkalicoccus sp. NIPERK01 TaxID=3053469 RepID=UPI00256EE03D|nr:5-methyltetrahydropteroyltriglutamate--homocysteine methyltransferase [Halalkalicoccus sp. NIPERK01]MDL5361177.1 5-methyltetrahydropteroyltriglutamate--homocysteine methyltransferase [Halalkalicoccus sp. NIPERK01]